MVCPLQYYYDYFRKYDIKRHDMRFIDVESIDQSDVVIMGGGGMLDYSESTNRAINRVLDTGATVIAWSPGFNTHAEYHGTFQTPLNFSQFSLLAVRDFENAQGLHYLPDVTCKLALLQKQYPLRRKYGIAQHKDYPIQGFDYACITNEAQIEDILQFIGESEIILSNSFHMIYWAMLMGKKTICVNAFSTKFQSYRYQPVYYQTGVDRLEDCVERAQEYHILEECIEATDAFFEQVKTIIEGKLTPIVAEGWRLFELTTQEVLLTERTREYQLLPGDLLASQLFIDTGEGFTEEQKLIAINNVVGDAIHTVRYDLTRFLNVQALRFDPIEGQNCKLELLSATDGAGAVSFTAQAALPKGKWDCFLTTDPQYFSKQPCKEYLEIKFRFQQMCRFEVEQAVYSYVGEASHAMEDQRRHVDQQAEIVATQNRQLGAQSETIAHQNGQLERQNEMIAAQSRQLGEQRETIATQGRQMEQRAETIEIQTHRLGEQDEIIASQRHQLKQQTGLVAAQSRRLGEQSETVASQTLKIEQQTELAVSQTLKIEQQCEELAALHVLLTARTQQIETLHQSTCWRMTAPIRWVLDWIKRPWKGK